MAALDSIYRRVFFLKIMRCSSLDKSYTFLGKPNSGGLVDSHSCEFFSVTIPSNMGHRLSAGYSVVAWLESRKSGWLHL